MSDRNAAMAVALRSMQWKLDDAAFKTGAGNLTQEECGELCAELGELATTLARYADASPVIIVDSEHSAP